MDENICVDRRKVQCSNMIIISKKGATALIRRALSKEPMCYVSIRLSLTFYNGSVLTGNAILEMSGVYTGYTMVARSADSR